MVTVGCYVDPVSPYAWLALRDLPRLEATGAAIRIVPVLFAGLLKTHGNLGPAEIPVKRRYVFMDVMREAARRGLPFEGPPGHPFNPLTALRMMTAVDNDAARLRLALALTAACWEDGADISDGDVAAQCATAAGFDGAALLAAAGTDAVKALLAQATEGAARAGVFGVPTFRIEGDAALFWGGDRVEALQWRLQGNAIDDAALASFLARAPLAVRT
nr:2-hydroxychromene-2-carboxylate isomerase [uncultured Massilia sp.]